MINILKGVAVVGAGMLIGMTISKLTDAKKTEEEKIDMEEIPEEIMEELDEESITKLKEMKRTIKKECRKNVIFNTILDGIIKIGLPLIIFRLITIRQKRISKLTMGV